jgi:DNA-binding MarR family transcriptional regulator
VPPAGADLARVLRRAHRSVERAMMAAVAESGLDMLRPGHMTVLRVLDPGSAGIRTSELARDADVSRQAVQQVVADLERLGIVESLPDEKDARARRVRYTPFGRRGYERCMREFARIERDMEDELGAGAVRRLKRDLAHLAGRVS